MSNIKILADYDKEFISSTISNFKLMRMTLYTKLCNALYRSEYYPERIRLIKEYKYKVKEIDTAIKTLIEKK